MSLEIFQDFLQTSWIANILPLTPVALIVFLIQSTLFLGLVLIADCLLKNKAANMRKFLWFWTLMMLPMATLVANLAPATPADQYFASAFGLPISADLKPTKGLALRKGNGLVSKSGAIATAETTEFSTGSQNAPVSGIFVDVKNWNWLVIAYFLIATTLLLRIPFGWSQLTRLRSTSFAADSERGAKYYRLIRDQIGYRGRCQIRLTDELESPVSFGVLNPIILFPRKYYDQLTDAELQSTLLHELSHIKHHDPLRMLLIKLIESLYFFQPLVWLASNRMHYLTELVADDSVLEAGVDASSYANSIVNMIELGFAPNHHYRQSTGIFSSPRMLVARMEHLLDDSCTHGTLMVRKYLLSSCLVLLTALIVTVQFSPSSSALAINRSGDQQIQAINIDIGSEIPEQLAQNNDDLYLELAVDRETVYVNEEIELFIRLFYTINGIRSPQFTELLLPNSVMQSIDAPNQYTQSIDGVTYGVYEKRYVLTPQNSGPLEIPDIRFRGEVTEGSSPTREISAFIEGLTIDVREAPAAGL